MGRLANGTKPFFSCPITFVKWEILLVQDSIKDRILVSQLPHEARIGFMLWGSKKAITTAANDGGPSPDQLPASKSVAIDSEISDTAGDIKLAWVVMPVVDYQG